MSDPTADERLDGFPIPDGAIVVPLQPRPPADAPTNPPLNPPTQSSGEGGEGELRQLRHLAITALRFALQERQLDLPLGPSLDPEDPKRLLSLNHLAVQLAITGLSSDVVSFATSPWRRQETAPQLLLVAAIDDELGVVHVPGVLTAAEVASAVGRCDLEQESLELPLEAFSGGLERLFTLALLVRPEALPRQALQPAAPMPLLSQVLDWCRGELSAALDGLGATLMPVSASAFRSGPSSAEAPPPGTLAIVALPLGLSASGELCTGSEALRCIERFRLLLIPTETTSAGAGVAGAEPRPDQLMLRLQADPVGDLIPDGVEITVFQGGRRQSLTTASSTALELRLPADDALIAITITPPSGQALQLPPLQILP
ncbi:MAG: hypothetical protein ACKO5F_13780 [Synechococcus sp.]